MKNLRLESGLSRRGFLAGSMGAFGAGALAGPLAFLATKKAEAANGGVGIRVEGPYGPVYPTTDMTTGLDLIALPRGFSYRSYSWTGDPLDDGTPCPSAHDGMAVVGATGPGNNQHELYLIRNHEQGSFGDNNSFAPPNITYDPRANGGTTTLRFKNGKWEGAVASLSGTIRNCAGGPTPWGSWLTCEETTNIDAANGLRHGYVFEVPMNGSATAEPIIAMGRFSHEAVAVDPTTGYVYETEDGSSGFYRFIPNDLSQQVGSLANGGELYMLKVVGQNNKDLRTPQPSFGDTYQVEWVLVDNPDWGPGEQTPFQQAAAKGGARFERLEGCWYDPVGDKVIFVDTSSAESNEGAVWSYDPRTETLTCIFAAADTLASDNPDNVAVSPRGGIILCEDGGDGGDDLGLSMMGLLPDGNTFQFARNNVVLNGEKNGFVGDFRDQEWAGACFSPDGKWLFANIQTPGITFAITGPWAKGIF